jgi:hypothetical protein
MKRLALILLLLGSFQISPVRGDDFAPYDSAYSLHSFAYYQPPMLLSMNAPAMPEKSDGVRWYTYGGIAAAHVGGSLPVYNYLTNTWGAPTGKFHIKDETADHLAFNDEVSHLFVSYKLTQGFGAAYRGLGFSDGRARLLGALESAFIMTFVEFPVDAYNPSQGLGITDLAADYLGIGLAWMKDANPSFENLDVKVSMRSFSNQYSRGLGEDQEDYDNYIYWLTYRYKFAVAGIGYGTTHPSPYDPDPSAYFGVGTTIPDLVGVFSKKLAGNLKPLELYFFNLNIEAF